MDKQSSFTSNSKTGTVLSCSMHFFCAMVGSGVLAYPKAVALLGWVAGVLLLVVFYLIALTMAFLLASVYRVNGLEFSRYHHAVNHILGKKAALACSIFQFITLFVVDIAWSITGATSAQAIANQFCVDQSNCFNKIWIMGLLFGAAELLLSQVRNLEEAWWVSAIGVVMSFIYSGIAFVIPIIHAANNGGQGTVGGIPLSPENKVMGIFNALGILAFGFSGGQVLIEIEDTLRQPPSAVKQMKKANSVAITLAFVFYLSVAVVGYAAYGNSVNGFIINSLGGPKWAIVLANASILIHVLTAFQVFAQAVFDTLESHAKWYLLKRQERKARAADENAILSTIHEKTASTFGFEKDKVEPLESRLSTQLSAALSVEYGIGQTSDSTIKKEETAAFVGVLPVISGPNLSTQQSMYALNTGLANEEVPFNHERVLAPLWVRIVVRSIYVLIVTLITVIMPFFSSISGLAGAIIFFPLIIYFPITLYRAAHGRQNKVFDNVLSVIFWTMLVVCLAAIVGSFYEIVQQWQDFQFFQ